MAKMMTPWLSRFRLFRKETSIERAFLILSLLLTTSVSIVFALGSVFSSRYLSENIFKERLQVTQALFTQGLSQDLMTGANHEIYRKCKAFFSDPGVVAVKITTSNGSEICAMSKPADQILNLKSYVFFDDERLRRAGSVDVSYSLDRLYHVYFRIVMTTVALILSLFFIQVIVLRKIGKKVTQPFQTLANKLKNGQLKDFLEFDNQSKIVEIKWLNEGLRELSLNSIEHEKSKILKIEADAVMDLASQVAHDIRSPIAALSMVEKELSELDEEKRLLVRSAVNRIKDIANNLLNQNREMQNGIGKNNAQEVVKVHEEFSSQLLPSILDPLITEKRMQFRSRIGIEIDARLDTASYGLFANIQATEFKRVISNLINNAVEALDDKGRITLSLTNKANQIELRIADNGNGIPPEILARLGKRGETYGKASGSGLGIFHARTSVEAWGGTLTIESQVGVGTDLILLLPKAASPDWFVSELLLKSGCTVVVLDDDSSIHAVWQGRFDTQRVQEKGIKVVHFSTPQELIAFANDNPQASTALYLADYELLGHKETGLELIKYLNIGPKSILVTSRFEEKQIRQTCESLKVRMIPKGMAGFVPIAIQPADREVTPPLKEFDLCLIDDDQFLIHPTWASQAKSKGLRIGLFSCPKEFLAAAPSIHPATPIYIDVSLGAGVSGIEFSHEVYHLGFKDISLATGYESDSLETPPFIRRIVGKDFPELGSTLH